MDILDTQGEREEQKPPGGYIHIRHKIDINLTVLY